jgi:hypothetical protein
MRARQRHLNPKAAGASVVFDSRYITGLSDGNNVSSWDDRSGNAKNATTASNYPTYETDGQGGNPVVRFVRASSQRLACSSSAYSGSGSKFLMVAYKSTTTGTYNSSAAGQSGQIFAFGIWFQMQARDDAVAKGDPFISGYGLNNSTQNNKSTPDNAWKVATGAYDGTTLYTRKNSVEIDSIARTMDTQNSVFRIGHADDNGTLSLFWGGDIAYIAAGGVAYSVSLLRRLEHAMGLSFKIACS